MSFQPVPKLVNLNDHNYATGPYFALFPKLGSFWGALHKSG